VLRAVLGVTQGELAAMVECSEPTIRSVETMRLQLSASLAKRITAASGVHPDWLLGGDPSAPIVGEDGNPYTLATFRDWRARAEAGAGEGCEVQTAAVRSAVRVMLAAARDARGTAEPQRTAEAQLQEERLAGLVGRIATAYVRAADAGRWNESEWLLAGMEGEFTRMQAQLVDREAAGRKLRPGRKTA
jgi:transcriptional regulator with XRE-family HTH domain